MGKTIYQVKSKGTVLKSFRYEFEAYEYIERLPKYVSKKNETKSDIRRVKRNKSKVREKVRYEVSEIYVSKFKYFFLNLFGGVE